MDFAHGLNYLLSDYFLGTSLAVAYLWPTNPAGLLQTQLVAPFALA